MEFWQQFFLEFQNLEFWMIWKSSNSIVFCLTIWRSFKNASRKINFSPESTWFSRIFHFLDNYFVQTFGFQHFSAISCWSPHKKQEKWWDIDSGKGFYLLLNARLLMRILAHEAHRYLFEILEIFHFSFSKTSLEFW